MAAEGIASLQQADVIRLFVRLIGYPTVEDVEGSYALIIVAEKRA